MTNTLDSFWSPSSLAVIESHRLRNGCGGVDPRYACDGVDPRYDGEGDDRRYGCGSVIPSAWPFSPDLPIVGAELLATSPFGRDSSSGFWSISMWKSYRFMISLKTKQYYRNSSNIAIAVAVCTASEPTYMMTHDDLRCSTCKSGIHIIKSTAIFTHKIYNLLKYLC